MHINELSGHIINSAITVHKELGPGLFESVYQSCLVIELEDRGFNVQTETSFPVTYRGKTISNNFRVDVLVEERIILELKSVEKVLPVHLKQLLTYLKLSKVQLGL